MLFRNTAPADDGTARSKLDSAIVVSVLAMAALNLLVMTDQLAPAKAYAAAPCNCAVAGVTLA